MEPTSETEKINADPFAADIFATTTEKEKPISAATAAETSDNAPEKEQIWSARLPRRRESEIVRDNLQIGLLQVFSAELSNRLTGALARLLNLPAAETLEIRLTDVREANQATDFSAEHNWWLSVGSGAAEIYLEFGDNFAVWLIDTALDEFQDSESAVAARPLTTTETAVLEYFAVNLAHETNLYWQSPQIRYRALSAAMPDALCKVSETENFSLLVYEFQTMSQNLPPAVFRIYLTSEALKSLAPNGGINTNTRRVVENLSAGFKNIRIRLVCGTAELTFGELAALQTGDVIVFDSQGFFPRAANFTKRSEVLCGDGNRQKIVGEPQFFDNSSNSFSMKSDAPANDKVAVRRIAFANSAVINIKSFAEFESSNLDEFMTETNNLTAENVAKEETAADAAGDEQENAPAVENLVVLLRVELEARRLPLAEISGLRENQTLELNVRPTDEVNILINERSVGRGELVLIEDERLGVRITKLLR